jgi:hypothetical protein
MNYRIVIVILTSLLIGASIGWFAGVKYTTTGIENVSSTPSISQIQPVSTKITEETAEKSIDIPLNKLGDCADAIVTLHPLVVKYAQNATCNCDEAQTTLEMNFCSSTKACIERKKFAILSQKVLAQYDPEIVEQNQFIAIAKKNNDPSMLEYVPDFKAAKALQEKSLRLYLDYAELESEIVGIRVGKGRERIIYENGKITELLEKKNKELEQLLKE